MIEPISPFLQLSPLVKEALQNKTPIVALESTVIAHGLPYPDNIDVTRKMMEAVEQSGAVPAVIALMNGFIHIGLTESELEVFARCNDILKVSRSDISYCLTQKCLGATTVSATMLCASYAGIRVFSTGGLGGVHRGAEKTFDISADLTEFSRTPILVVCSGAKSILDIPKTLEFLETQGVPVVGYQTDNFPLFFTKDSSYPLIQHLNTPQEIALLAQNHWTLGLKGLVITNPIPEADSIHESIVEKWINKATEQASKLGVIGKAVTPFVLSKVAELSANKTLHANKALLINNALLAGKIAASLKG